MISRSYSCKDEELSAIGGLVANSLERDKVDFLAYAPLYDEAFIENFVARTAAIQELVDPQSELLLRVSITTRMHATMTGLLTPVDRLSDYVRKAGKTLPLTQADFGIPRLKDAIYGQDVEVVADALNTVVTNAVNHATLLKEKGLTDSQLQMLKDARASMMADRQQQQGMTTAHKALVQSNLGTLNDYYATLTDILATGKSLYQRTDKVKLADYTFAHLHKRVNQTAGAKKTKGTTGVAAQTTDTSAG